MSTDSWPPNSPQTLSEICLDYCIKSLTHTICDYDESTDRFTLKPGISLPPSVSDELFRSVSIRRQHLSIFCDPERALCKRLNLETITDLTDAELKHLLSHRPVELRISSDKLTVASVHEMNANAQNLNTLAIYNSSEMFASFLASMNKGRYTLDGREDMTSAQMMFNCPLLRSFTLRGIDHSFCRVLKLALHGLPLLTKVDLSDCDIDCDSLYCALKDLQCVQILRLQNVDLDTNDVRRSFDALAHLKTLRVLDISQSQSVVSYNGDITASMAFLMTSLSRLTHLDISGTNLAGWINSHVVSHRPSSVLEKSFTKPFAIPGLEGHYLEFLGLLSCAYQACEREDLPARQVTGDANEQQILLSVEVYIDSVQFLILSLNELFNLLKDGLCTNHVRALLGILSAMKHHMTEKRVQISGSASLFYIVKGVNKHHLTTNLKRTIISRLLDAMEQHMVDATMLRNGCLTLCHFVLPHDVMYCYPRLVKVLLQMMLMTYEPPDTFIQCIGVNILNSLACQVDYSEKRLLGQLGAIDVMLKLIQERLRQGVCDEVMLYSWSMMWNMTDETDINCKRFIDQEGLQTFNECRKKFPDQEELLRNMMGLMGNVAEVQSLRRCLMSSSYVTIFSDLLVSESDGIEVSYNACGVLANLMSDGPSAWTVVSPSRSDVLGRMVSAIRRWKLNSKRSINYRSFNPILRLIPMHDIPQIQYWAVWALCNLTKINRDKYCPLLEKEGGLGLLRAIAADDRPYPEVRTMAKQVIARCSKFCTSGDSSGNEVSDSAAAGNDELRSLSDDDSDDQSTD